MGKSRRHSEPATKMSMKMIDRDLASFFEDKELDEERKTARDYLADKR